MKKGWKSFIITLLITAIVDALQLLLLKLPIKENLPTLVISSLVLTVLIDRIILGEQNVIQ